MTSMQATFMRDANGHIVLTAKGEPTFDKTGSNDRFLGNMNSKWQMGWTNTFNYKEFQLSFLINGRIGGKVLSLTESYLDYIGASERTEAASSRAQSVTTSLQLTMVTYQVWNSMMVADASFLSSHIIRHWAHQATHQPISTTEQTSVFVSFHWVTPSVTSLV